MQGFWPDPSELRASWRLKDPTSSLFYDLIDNTGDEGDDGGDKVDEDDDEDEVEETAAAGASIGSGPDSEADSAES